MATYFKNVLKSELGITETEILAVASNARATVIGLSLTNLTGGVVLISIRVEDDTMASAYYIKDVILPPNQSLRVVNVGERLVLAPSTTMYINASVDNSLDLLMSYVEIV